LERDEKLPPENALGQERKNGEYSWMKRIKKEVESWTWEISGRLRAVRVRTFGR
jgi:hypothetical protein